MALEVLTNDASALTDDDLAEMIAIEGAFDLAFLEGCRESWVLVTTARDGGTLHGYTFSTLERIGGTPCVLLGVMSVRRNAKRDTVLKGLMKEAFHRALMAFPDEDVVFGTQLINPGAFEVFRDLEQELPKYGHKVSGEERAWGTRFAKRLGVSSLAYDDRTFVALGDGSTPRIFDYESAKEDKVSKDVQDLFKAVQVENGDTLIALAWAMAERLEKLGR